MKRWCLSLSLAVIQASLTFAGEVKKIDLKEVAASVKNAADKIAPGVSWRAAFMETIRDAEDFGQDGFIETLVGTDTKGRSVYVQQWAANTKFVEAGLEVSYGEVPQAVRDALQKDASDLEPTTTYSVRRKAGPIHGPAEFYHFQSLPPGGTSMAVRFLPSGKQVATEQVVSIAMTGRADVPKLVFETVTSEAGRFIAEMPGSPDVESKGGDIPETQFLCSVSNRSGYGIFYYDLPAEGVLGQDPRKLLQGAQTSFVAGKELVADKEVTLGKVPGRQFLVAGTDRYFRERMYLAGSRLYRLVVFGPDFADPKDAPASKDFVNSKDSDRFFDSFKITGGADPAEPRELEFQKVVSKEGRFAIEMPGKPEEKTEQYESGFTRVSFAVRILTSEAVRNFHVSYMDIEEANVKGKDPQTVLKAFRSGFRSDAKFEGDREFTLGKEMVPGLAYRLEASTGTFIRERLFLAGNRLYILFIASLKDKDFLHSKQADRFFESFEIRP